MPYPGVPKSQTKKVEKVVTALQKKGYSKKSAIKIAMSQRKK